MTGSTNPSAPHPEVLLAVDASIARITIDRPNKRNALSPTVIARIGELLTEAEDDRDARVVVLTGSGDGAFSAGGDLGSMSDAGQVARHFERAGAGELFARMRASRLPIIARVNGHALAGGFGLLLACDLVVAVEDAELGTPEIDVGLWPFMISALIQRDVPRKVALELMLTGRRMGASEGERWGFVNRVVPRAALDDNVDELARTVAAKSAVTVELGKRSFYRSEDLRFDDAVDYLAGMLTLCLESEDALEGISAFLQKRKPEWKGR